MHWIQCYKGDTVTALEGRQNLLKRLYCVQMSHNLWCAVGIFSDNTEISTNFSVSSLIHGKT